MFTGSPGPPGERRGPLREKKWGAPGGGDAYYVVQARRYEMRFSPPAKCMRLPTKYSMTQQWQTFQQVNVFRNINSRDSY